MPGVDIYAELGASEWTTVDAGRLQHTLQRARFDLLGVASRQALEGDIEAGNAEVKAVLDKMPQMRGWVVVNPAYPEKSAQELRRYVTGAKWLGATLQRGHRTHLTSGPSKEVINSYRRYTKPLLVHVPDDQSVRELEELALEFAQMKFVALGGGGDFWHDCMLAAKRAVNIFIEPFSGGAHRGKVETLLATLGHHRIVFASGFPERNPGTALGLLTDTKMSDPERQAILTSNAVRLFNLGRAQDGE